MQGNRDCFVVPPRNDCDYRFGHCGRSAAIRSPLQETQKGEVNAEISEGIQIGGTVDARHRSDVGAVTLPVAAVSDGKAHFYKIPLEGKEIDFFVIKAGDGAIKTAFDACDVCYRAKKGYEQQDGDMVCKNCNKKFAANRIGPHEVGGCNPSHLPHAEAGGNIIIRIEDLKTGARFF